MIKIWHDTAWNDYLSWQAKNKKMVGKINKLLKEIERSGYKCIGKPEPLKNELSGKWSVRIDDEHRIVFKIENGQLIIYSCKGHYKK